MSGAGGNTPGVLGVIVRARRWVRAAFWVYAIVLFVGLHWPALDVRIEGVERPDLIVHLGAFSVWSLLLWATGYAGAIDRWGTLLIVALMACGYAALDERLQAVPWIRRNCAWDDLQANWMGVGIGVIVAAVIVGLSGRGKRTMNERGGDR